MECTINKDKIYETLSEVNQFSLDQKRDSIFQEDAINKFLDTINLFKELLNEKITLISDINKRIEEITWVNVEENDNDCFLLLNELISLSKELHRTLIMQYINLSFLRKKGIAKEEIKDFKYQIDVLKELYIDIEDIFFNLPQVPEFTEITKTLSLIA